MDPITTSIRELEDKLHTHLRPGGDRSSHQWAALHLDAWRNPQGFELPLWHLIRGLAQYGVRMQEQCGTKAGDDTVLGPAFKDIAEAILTLLNGNIGRFDGGTLDALVRAICAEHGVELDK